MLVTRDDSTGKAVKVQGDPSHPITKGYLCNKVNHYLDLVYNDNRVMYPIKELDLRDQEQNLNELHGTKL